MLNILELVLSLEKGGRSVRFKDTIQGLREKGHTVVPLCLSRPMADINIADLIVNIRKPGIDLPLIKIIHQLIKKHNIDIVHAHCEHTQLYGGIACFLANTPIVATFHRSNLKHYQPSILNSLLKFFISSFVAVSDDRVKLLQDNLQINTQRSRVISGGTLVLEQPDELAIVAAKQRLSIESDHLILLSIGHLGEIKGHQDTLVALHDLLTDFPKIHLYIAGDGSQSEKTTLLSIIEKLALADHVSLLGQINNADDWLTACDIFVQPSIEEAFGLVFIEAGSKAKPVVSTAVGGIKEIIVHNETGLLVSPKSPQELAKAIAICIENPEKRKQMGNNAYDRVASKYTLEHMISNYLDEFTKQLKLKSKKRIFNRNSI